MVSAAEPFEKHDIRVRVVIAIIYLSIFFSTALAGNNT
jgi:hypothetical protein